MFQQLHLESESVLKGGERVKFFSNNCQEISSGCILIYQIDRFQIDISPSDRFRLHRIDKIVLLT